MCKSHDHSRLLDEMDYDGMIEADSRDDDDAIFSKIGAPVVTTSNTDLKPLTLEMKNRS